MEKILIIKCKYYKYLELGKVEDIIKIKMYYLNRNIIIKSIKVINKI